MVGLNDLTRSHSAFLRTRMQYPSQSPSARFRKAGNRSILILAEVVRLSGSRPLKRIAPANSMNRFTVRARTKSSAIDAQRTPASYITKRDGCGADIGRCTDPHRASANWCATARLFIRTSAAGSRAELRAGSRAGRPLSSLSKFKYLCRLPDIRGA